MPQNIDRRSAENTHLKRRKWLSMLGVGGTMAVAGCLGGDDDEEGEDDDDVGDPDAGVDHEGDIPDVNGTYNDVQGSGFDTLNPIYNTEAGAAEGIGYALDMGYTFTPDLELFPLLYDLTTDDGGETWTFDFREGLEFSDPYGEFTADDFVYYVEEVHQSDTFPSANSPDWNGVELEQTGEYEVVATLPSANLLWPETYDPLEYPIPRDLIEPYVEDEDVDGMREDEELIELEFAGNLGAYVLENWVRDGGTSYTRNDEYYLRDVAEENGDYAIFAEAPYFEELELEIIEEESSRISALQTGAADHVTLPPDRGEQFIEDDDTRVVLADTPYNNILSVNMRDNGWTAGPGNLFQVKEFRQALAAAIDKPRLIEGVYRGFHDEHYTWQPEFSEWFPGTDDLTLWGHPEGVYGDEARDLAEQALDQIDEDYYYDGGDLLTPDGDQVELELYYNAASETQELAAGFFEEEFEQHLGFTLSTNAIDGTRFSEQYWSAQDDIAEAGTSITHEGNEFVWQAPGPNNPGPREYTPNESWDLGTIFGLNTYPLNPLTNQVFFDGAGTFYNPVGYYPEFDVQGLFEQARNAEDRDELQDAMNQLFVELNQEQPYIMLTFGVDIEGYNPDLVGPIADFMNGWDSPAWHFDE